MFRLFVPWLTLFQLETNVTPSHIHSKTLNLNLILNEQIFVFDMCLMIYSGGVIVTDDRRDQVTHPGLLGVISSSSAPLI